MRAVTCLVLSAVVLACRPQPPSAPAACNLPFTNRGDVRVFVMGHFQRMEDNATYADFDRAWRRHLEAVGACFSHDRPNLVVFPEDAGLGALLLGRRNAPARAAGNSTVAFLLGAVGQVPGMAYYQAEFPGVSLARSLLLAASDPVWRATQGTFGGLARDFGVWVALTVNVAVTTESMDVDLTRVLKDPDAPWGTPAHVASRGEVFNQAVLFAPDGTLHGRVPKVFLTTPEEEILDLNNGRLDTLPVWDTPFGRVGVATSRDAFYPPFMQRLEDLDVALVLQPEAFSGWTVAEENADEWLPDVFLSSGWLHTQKYRTIRHSLNSVYVGNFLDLTFDGQAHITQKATPADRLLRYVGSRWLPGFLDVGPWVMPDPADADPALDVAARRNLLRARGEAMVPGARRGPLRNAYVDSVVAQDLELPRAEDARAVVVARDVSQPPSAALEHVPGAGHQRHQDVAGDGADLVVAAWMDARSGVQQVHVAFSADGGRTFGGSRAAAPSTTAQGKPAVCVGEDGTGVLVWQQGPAGQERVVAARLDLQRRAVAQPVPVTGQAPAAQWEADCGRVEGGFLLAWTDFSRGPAPAVVGAMWRDGSRSPDAPTPVDGSTAALPRMLATQVQPAVSARGGHVVWLDGRARSWDVHHARWNGAGFEHARRVDGVSGSAERLHGEPDVWAQGNRVVVTWTDLHGRRGATDIGWVESQDGGETFEAHATVPGGVDGLPGGLGREGGLPRFRPQLATRGGEPVAVFQDLTPGHNVVMLAGRAQQPRRVDDMGASAVNLTRPRAVAVTGGVLVTWEDDRYGAWRICWALVPPEL